MKSLHIISVILLIIGGLNWLLVAFGYNLVESLFGLGFVAKLIYVLVGLSAIYEIFAFKKWIGGGEMSGAGQM